MTKFGAGVVPSPLAPHVSLFGFLFSSGSRVETACRARETVPQDTMKSRHRRHAPQQPGRPASANQPTSSLRVHFHCHATYAGAAALRTDGRATTEAGHHAAAQGAALGAAWKGKSAASIWGRESCICLPRYHHAHFLSIAFVRSSEGISSLGRVATWSVTLIMSTDETTI